MPVTKGAIPLLGWKKGRGIQPMAEQPRVAEDVTVSTQTTGTLTTPKGKVQCAVEGCGKLFLKARPMGTNHVTSKHPQVLKEKNWETKYLKAV